MKVEGERRKMSNAYEEYMRQMVIPMRQELVRAGFEELTTEEAVTEYMEQATGTTLVVVNSVCGCAAGLARPSAGQAVVRSEKRPDHLVTVFAGQDKRSNCKNARVFWRDSTIFTIYGFIKRKRSCSLHSSP